jgi:hypothetical protein
VEEGELMDREQYVTTFGENPNVAVGNALSRVDNVAEFYIKAEKTACPKCGDVIRAVNGQVVAYHNRKNGEKCYVDYRRAVAAGAITREAAIAEGWDGK